TCECCCAYNMLKLSRHLYGWEPQAGYFDYYERLLLNHRIGTIRPNAGTTQYYLSLTPGVWKTFNTEDQTFWCCTGTGIEEYAKLTDSIYWRDEEGVYVNLFIASELDWQEERFKLRQDTKYPESSHTALACVEHRRGAGPGCGPPLRARGLGACRPVHAPDDLDGARAAGGVAAHLRRGAGEGGERGSGARVTVVVGVNPRLAR